jgi:hypothetical protein
MAGNFKKVKKKRCKKVREIRSILLVDIFSNIAPIRVVKEKKVLK